MLYRILEKLNNFSILFTIFIITLAIIVNTTISIIAKDASLYKEIKYFNAGIFIILVIVFFNILFTWITAHQTKNKQGSIGGLGIQGQIGHTGTDGKCDLDCGQRVCYANITKDINIFFNKELKDNKAYLAQLVQNELYAGHIKYVNEKELVKLRYRGSYLNSELNGRNKKIEEIVVYPDHEFIINTNDKITLPFGKHDTVKLSSMGIESSDIADNIIGVDEFHYDLSNFHWFHVHRTCQFEWRTACEVSSECILRPFHKVFWKRDGRQ